MPYLLANITFLLLLAALLSGIFTFWLLRRHYEDVTVEYTSLRDDWGRWRKSLAEKLALPPSVDLEPIRSRMQALETAVRAIDIPRPQPTDLGPVLGALAGIRIPEPTRVDLDPIITRLAALEKRVADIRIPQPAAPPDLGPLQAKLADVDQAVRAIVIPTPERTDLGPVQARIGALEEAVRGIHVPAVAPPVDLAPVQARLGELEQAIRAIVIPTPKEPDLSALMPRIGAIETRLGALRMPEAAPAVDLAPLQQGLESVQRAVGAIRIPPQADLGAIEVRLAGLERKLSEFKTPEPAQVDLAPTHQRLDALESAVRTIAIPLPREPDFSPVLVRLGQVEQRVAGIRIPEPTPQSVDLEPLQERIGQLEAAVRTIVIPPSIGVDLQPILERMNNLEAKLPPPAPSTPAPQGPSLASALSNELVRAGSRNLLARAAFGKPDDLKIIKGVAHVLEKMLHRVGVYYFWQIAEWTASDVAHVDAQLTAFKGRIQRDDWVRQALEFARRSDSARKPQ